MAVHGHRAAPGCHLLSESFWEHKHAHLARLTPRGQAMCASPRCRMYPMALQVLKDYKPGDAPPELLGAAATAAQQCNPVFTVCGLRLLEAALLLAFLGALAAWLYSLLSLPRLRQPHTPASVEDPAAPLVLADFPRFSHPKKDASWPTSSNSRSWQFDLLGKPQTDQHLSLQGNVTD